MLNGISAVVNLIGPASRVVPSIRRLLPPLYVLGVGRALCSPSIFLRHLSP